jgi:hypothetical protein
MRTGAHWLCTGGSSSAGRSGARLAGVGDASGYGALTSSIHYCRYLNSAKAQGRKDATKPISNCPCAFASLRSSPEARPLLVIKQRKGARTQGGNEDRTIRRMRGASDSVGCDGLRTTLGITRTQSNADCPTCSGEVATNLIYNRSSSANQEARPVTIHPASAAAPRFHSHRQAPASQPAARLRADFSPCCETNPFSYARLRTPLPRRRDRAPINL